MAEAANKIHACVLASGAFWDRSCLEMEGDGFTAKVDWDVDHTSTEGCRGRDAFVDDPPQKLHFRILDGGTMMVSGFDRIHLVSPKGKLFWLEPQSGGPFVLKDELRFPIRHAERLSPRPQRGEVHTMKFMAYSANYSFHRCYSESVYLNYILTPIQRVAVERFFDAVERTFPIKYFSPRPR